ncbi:MAG: ATP-dependent DNA helicase RecG, partial [Gramella sp.]|nr:ATP-dependent DNA helicase RecG [Christiangramia sp.]
MIQNLLQTPIEYLKGVGPNRAEVLKKELNIQSYRDLINFFPNRYIDKTGFYKIQQLQQNSSEVQIVGKIVHMKMVEQKRGKRLVADFVDDTGKMELIWFRGHKWIRENLKLNTPYVIFGKTSYYNGLFSMPHPEMELVADYKKNLRTAMQPVYPSTEMLQKKGITNRVIMKLMQEVLQQTGLKFSESLSLGLIKELKLLSKAEALFNIHFPKNQELLAKAQFRLKFEELFFIQLQLLRKNMLHKQKI